MSTAPGGGDETTRRPARGARVLWLAAAIVAIVAVIVVYVSQFLVSGPGAYATQASGRDRVADVTLQTVAAAGPADPHPDWVSYFIRDRSGHWRHPGTIVVPAHALVRITVYQYDGDSGLRNPLFARPEGTVGGAVSIDGRTVRVIDPDTASHTFVIPQLGVVAPLPGVPDNAPNQCAAAPCTTAQAHRTIVFEFRTGGPGNFRWQCFVPCAAGFIDGFGGPMQTIGYMNGYLRVV